MDVVLYRLLLKDGQFLNRKKGLGLLHGLISLTMSWHCPFKKGVKYIRKPNEKSAKLYTQNLSVHCRVCNVHAPCSILSRVCRVQGLSVQGLFVQGLSVYPLAKYYVRPPQNQAACMRIVLQTTFRAVYLISRLIRTGPLWRHALHKVLAKICVRYSVIALLAQKRLRNN
jgi:hypothetical protein